MVFGCTKTSSGEEVVFEIKEKLCMDFTDTSKWDDVTVARCVQRIKKFLAEIDG